MRCAGKKKDVKKKKPIVAKGNEETDEEQEEDEAAAVTQSMFYPILQSLFEMVFLLIIDIDVILCIYFAVASIYVKNYKLLLPFKDSLNKPGRPHKDVVVYRENANKAWAYLIQNNVDVSNLH